jgi:uncharacterized membrane protein
MAASEPDERSAGGPADSTAEGARPGRTGASTGLEPNQAAAVAYLLGAITGVLLLVTDDDEFVRFHAVQSVALTAVAVGVYAVFGVVVTVLGFVPFVGGLFVALFGLASLLVGLVGFGVWLVAIHRALGGEWFEFPVVGGFARRY